MSPLFRLIISNYWCSHHPDTAVLLHTVNKTRMPPSGFEEAGDPGLPQNLLLYLEKHNHFDTFEYATANGEDHQRVVGAVKSLEAVEGVCYVRVYFFILLLHLSFVGNQLK